HLRDHQRHLAHAPPEMARECRAPGELIMATGFAAVPAADRYVIANATLPAPLIGGIDLAEDGDGLVRADISVAAGRIAGIAAPGSAHPTLSRVDLDGGMAWPCFVDMHTHLDKGHIWPRRPNPDGTFLGALDAVDADRRERWS